MKKGVSYILGCCVAAISIGCSIEEDSFDNQHSSVFSIALQMPSDVLKTRVQMAEKDSSKDLSPSWKEGDVVQVIARRGNEIHDLGFVDVTNISEDGKTAYIVADVREFPSIEVPFTLFCLTGNENRGGAYAIGGGEWAAVCAYSVSRSTLGSFSAPLYSRIDVKQNEVSVGRFEHVGTYELLHMKNDTDLPMTFSHRGFDVDYPWYRGLTNVWFYEGYDHTELSGEWEGEAESEEVVIMPHSERVIISCYIPSGYKVNQATLVASVNGKVTKSANTLTSNLEITRSHAYHMYATWDGTELRFKQMGEEPLDVRTLSATVDPRYLSGSFIGTVANPPLSEIKTGFRFWKENNEEDYVEFDSSSSDDDGSFSLDLTYYDFVYIANESPVEGKYFVSAFAIDAKGNRHPGNILEFTIDSEYPEALSIPDAVDLGLSVKWASFNLGAAKPEEYGFYYSWGETKPKRTYTWGSYKWCNGSERSLTKYNSDSSYGTVDNKTMLEPEDDAAHVNLGGEWRMPTKAEQDELRNNCDWAWVTINGVKGYKVSSRVNNNYIFLPANSVYGANGISDIGVNGDYWSSNTWPERPFDAYDMDFTSDFHAGNTGRFEGRGIRAVYADEPITSITTNTPTNISPCSVEIPFTISTNAVINDFGVIYSTDRDEPVVEDCGDGGYVSYYSPEFGKSMIICELKPNTTYYARVFVTLGGENGTRLYGNTVQFTTKGLSYSTEYVDIGLSVKWATCNLGSASSSNAGGYYAWGETIPTTMRTSYKWSGTDGFTKYNANDGKVILEASDDAAYVNLGDGWRMPTNEELAELRNNCTWTQATMDGVQGCIVTGPNGNSIFIPISKGFDGEFEIEILSSELTAYYEDYQYVHALSYRFSESYVYFLSTFRDWGTPIRPVFDDSYIPVESITLVKSELELAVGETASLVVTISPSNATNQSVTWTSSDESVATVSGTGTVTGLSAGSAVITATTVDGGKVAKCNVNVKRTGIEIVDQGSVIVYTINGVELRMVKVEGGTFRMGSHHDVTLSTYYISDRPVSKRLYSAIVNGVDSGDDGLYLSTWAGKSADILKINELTGGNFHLPSEAQFEFAAKGGIYSHGYTYAGTNDNSLLTSNFPNELNLYMMSSNREWVYDYCCAYPSSAVVDPVESVWKKNWASGDWHNETLMRVVRGSGPVESRGFLQPYHPNNQMSHRLVFETTNDAAWKNGDYVGDYK